MSRDELSESLAVLSGLLTAHLPLREALVEIARLAVHAIPGAEGAGLTVLEEGRAQTVVATAAFVHEVDDIQYDIGEGPCLTAVESGATQTSGSLGEDPRWPRFGSRMGRMGVHSALSLPLLLPDRAVGALNVYAHGHQAFTPESVAVGEAFARPAAVAVQDAPALAASERLTEQLLPALDHRAVMDQAVGVLMSRTGAGPENAFAKLKAMSEAEHMNVSEMARVLVDEAVQRARARTNASTRRPPP